MVDCLTTGGCTFNPVFPQPPSNNFSSPTTAPTTAPLNGTCGGPRIFFSAAYENFGLVINTEKVAAMPPDAVYVAPEINVNGVQMQVMDNFTYLDSILPLATPKSAKWPAGFPNPAKPMTVCKTQFGIDTLSPTEELARDRLTWRRTVKTGAAIYEANRITAAKAKREARKPQLRPHPSAKNQPPQSDHNVSGSFGHQSVLLDIFEPTAAPGRHYPIPPSTFALPPTSTINPSRDLLPLSSFPTVSTPAAAAPEPRIILVHRQN
ncbi:hypothetical protein SprV_0301042500 [Sparganum proliferum]